MMRDAMRWDPLREPTRVLSGEKGLSMPDVDIKAGLPESVDSLLDLARALADGLARAPRDGTRDGDLRLAHALALNVVDLLEGVRGH